MTGPMTFTPTPFPTLDDECDGVAAFTGVSTVSGENFDKLRTFFVAPPTRFLSYQSRQLVNLDPLPAGLRAWSSLPASQFPGLTVPVPPACPAILVSFTGAAGAKGSAGTWTEFGVDFGGSGLSAALSLRCLLYVRNGLLRGTRSHLLLSGELASGGQLVLTPGLAYDSTGSNSHAVYGVIDALVFTGA